MFYTHRPEHSTPTTLSIQRTGEKKSRSYREALIHSCIKHHPTCRETLLYAEMTFYRLLQTANNTQRKIYSDVFAKWPQQALRPDYQFQEVLGKAVDARFKTLTAATEQDELLKARGLQFLLQDKFRDRVR